MQQSTRFSALPEYAFPRLHALLADLAPGGPVVNMSIGEPQHAIPDFVGDILARHVATLSSYPPNDGIPALRQAISDWLGRRHGVGPDWRDPDRHILPLNGTREGLFNACLALSPAKPRAVVLLPNPFYQCYAAAALAVGATPHYLPATAATGHLPDLDAIPADILDRTTVFYLCSPANPQGAVADTAYWRRLLTLADRHDFRVFADECYSEIWRHQPPVSALRVAADMGADPERLVVFQSLSKRSNLAGLRSGFAVTGAGNRAAMLRLRAYTGAPMPIPAQHAAAAVWADEDHVTANRALYTAKFDLADHILGNLSGYSAPEAGFFLWVRVGDGQAAVRQLWSRAGVRALPGAYLSRADVNGDDPGLAYVRLALVAPIDDVARGLAAVAAVLSDLGA